MNELEEQRGYAAQMRWLEGEADGEQPKTLSEARHALEMRRASIQRNPWNLGGNRATGDYIERLERDGDLIEVTLVIDNIYEDGEEIQTTVETRIPPPPFPPGTHTDEGEDWEQEHIFNHTGTGKVDGDAGYFVEVTKSSRPELLPVGTEFEFC